MGFSVEMGGTPRVTREREQSRAQSQDRVGGQVMRGGLGSSVLLDLLSSEIRTGVSAPQ